MEPKQTTDTEIKRPPTRSIYHLNYENACKVIDFICQKDTGAMDSDYANISPGKVHTQVNDENWQAVVDFLLELDVRFEVMDATDNVCIAKSYGNRVVDKENGIRKPLEPIFSNGVTESQLESVIEGCNNLNTFLKTQRARDILSNKKRKDSFLENNYLIARCEKELKKLKQKANQTV